MHLQLGPGKRYGFIFLTQPSQPSSNERYENLHHTFWQKVELQICTPCNLTCMLQMLPNFAGLGEFELKLTPQINIQEVVAKLESVLQQSWQKKMSPLFFGMSIRVSFVWKSSDLHIFLVALKTTGNALLILSMHLRIKCWQWIIMLPVVGSEINWYL